MRTQATQTDTSRSPVGSDYEVFLKGLFMEKLRSIFCIYFYFFQANGFYNYSSMSFLNQNDSPDRTDAVTTTYSIPATTNITSRG
jgi:hypothetical protein